LADRARLWSNVAVLSRARVPVIAALSGVWVTTAAPAAGVRQGLTSHRATSSVRDERRDAVPAPASKPQPAAERHLEPEPAELDAVVATTAARELSANTPMDDANATRHLAAAWLAVSKTPASEQTLCVLWAHWAHETGRGQRMHAFNFAGLKGRGPTGASVVVWTREGRVPELVQRTFRAYRTPSEGARDYVQLLFSRYPSAARAARDGNAYAFATALETGGYFTGDGRTYVRALSSLSLEFRRRRLHAALRDGE
jgi:flagellum-specific peptidoglycan hydrolase FlgJ